MQMFDRRDKKNDRETRKRACLVIEQRFNVDRISAGSTTKLSEGKVNEFLYKRQSGEGQTSIEIEIQTNRQIRQPYRRTYDYTFAQHATSD